MGANSTPFVNKIQLRTLQHHHEEIIRLKVLGMRNRDVAKRIGLSQAFVSTICGSELARTRITNLKAKRDVAVASGTDFLTIHERIEKMAPAALKKLEALMEKDTISDTVLMKTAQDLLDRAGYSPVKQVISNSTNTNIQCDADMVAILKQRAEQADMIVPDSFAESAEDSLQTFPLPLPVEGIENKKVIDIQATKETRPENHNAGKRACYGRAF